MNNMFSPILSMHVNVSMSKKELLAVGATCQNNREIVGSLF